MNVVIEHRAVVITKVRVRSIVMLDAAEEVLTPCVAIRAHCYRDILQRYLDLARWTSFVEVRTIGCGEL